MNCDTEGMTLESTSKGTFKGNRKKPLGDVDSLFILIVEWGQSVRPCSNMKKTSSCARAGNTVTLQTYIREGEREREAALFILIVE